MILLGCGSLDTINRVSTLVPVTLLLMNSLHVLSAPCEEIDSNLLLVILASYRHTSRTYKARGQLAKKYHMHTKFRGLIFCVFDWQENSWGINFCAMAAW